MSENQQVDQQAQPDSSAVTQNTEHMIPKSRFDEVNEQRKLYEAKLKEYQDKEAQQQQQEALQKGEHLKVIDQLKPKAERADVLEGVLKSYLQTELESIPEKFRNLVPTGDVTHQLTWINEAKKSGLFSAPEKATAQPLDGNQGSRRENANQALTAAEEAVIARLGISREAYLKNKK